MLDIPHHVLPTSVSSECAGKVTQLQVMGLSLQALKGDVYNLKRGW